VASELFIIWIISFYTHTVIYITVCVNNIALIIKLCMIRFLVTGVKSFRSVFYSVLQWKELTVMITIKVFSD